MHGVQHIFGFLSLTFAIILSKNYNRLSNLHANIYILDTSFVSLCVIFFNNRTILVMLHKTMRKVTIRQKIHILPPKRIFSV